MKRTALPIKVGWLLVIAALLLSGCAYKGVDKRSFVVGVGVDPAKDPDSKYRVTLKIAKPIASLKSATETDYAFLTHESDSVSEAIRYLETQDDKVVDFSQAKVLALNEDLMNEDLFPLMDYFVRRGDIQLVLYVMIGKPSAEDMLKVKPKLESAAENSLYNYFDDTGTESPFVTTTFLFEFRRDYDTKGKSAVLPIVEGNGSAEHLTVNKSIVLKSGVPSVTLNPTETKLYNTLMKGSTGYGYRIEEDGYQFTLTFDKVTMKIKIVTAEDGKPTAVVNIKAVGAINESNKLLRLKGLPRYNEISEKRLTQQVEKLFKDMQAKNVDPFGFGLKYRASRLNDKDTAKNWESMYADLSFDVQVTVDLKSIGAIQ